MTQLTRTKNRRALTAFVIGLLILAGSVIVNIVARNGGIVAGESYTAGTVLEVPGGSSVKMSVTGDNLEITVGTSPSLSSGKILVESDGFRKDTRAKIGTYGLRAAVGSSGEGGACRLTVVVPDNGTLTLTLVGDAHLVLDETRLKELVLAGVSSTLEMDASDPGSVIDDVRIQSVTGGFSGQRLGNLDMERLTVGSITGTYDLDLSGSLRRHCDISLQRIVGNGTVRISGTPGARLTVRNIVGGIVSSGLTDDGQKTFLNSSAASGAERQVILEIGSVVGQIKLVEAQQ